MAVTEATFEKVVEELLRLSAIELPEQVLAKLREAYETEEDETARKQFEAIFNNCRIAHEKQVGVCQDNGLIQLFIDFGQKCRIEGDLEAAADRAVAKGTKIIPLRENVIHPLSKKNTGTNVGPHMPTIEWRPLPEADYLEVTVAPKGFGAEMRAYQNWVLSSEDLRKAVIRCALDAVGDVMGEPCPPLIMGIAVGGHFESNMVQAKRALFRLPIGSSSEDALGAELEKEILESVNSLGLGPMGFGGKNYALAVHVEISGTHTAEIPIAIAFQCWAHRFSTARIYDDGRVEFLTHPYGSIE